MHEEVTVEALSHQCMHVAVNYLKVLRPRRVVLHTDCHQPAKFEVGTAFYDVLGQRHDLIWLNS